MSAKVAARRALDETFSPEEVMAHLGVRSSKLHALLALGRAWKGCHPLRGGLWPTFKVSHKVRRITRAAIEQHKAHMERLDTDPLFLAQMKARARVSCEEGVGCE